MKILILYASFHHKNTEKLIEGISKKIEIDKINILKHKGDYNIEKYDIVGFASGIYAGRFHKKIRLDFEKIRFNQGQKVFFIATCGAKYKDHGKGMRKIAIRKNVKVVGTFQCKGFDTFGPLKLIGGIAKDHPNEKDIDNGISFLKSIIDGN